MFANPPVGLFAFVGVVSKAYWCVLGGGRVVTPGRGRGFPDDGSCYTTVTRALDVPETTFTGPDLTTFLGLDALKLTAVGWRPTQLVVRVRRFVCTHCCRVWRQDPSRLAEPRARLTRSVVEWGLRALALECMSVSRVAAALGVAWHTASTAILASAQAMLLDDPHRFDGVEVLGVDEHVWRHTRRGDKYVTVVIDLTPVRDRSGPARLLDVAPGRSKKVLKTWLAQRDQAWRQRVEVVAMDGFTGFKSAAGEELPQARAVMDPFHVVSLAAGKVDECRRRTQQAITGRRGRQGDPLYRAWRTLRTGAGLLTDAQAERLEALFADERHAAVQASWGVYQRLIQAYRAEDPGLGKHLMRRLISSLRQAVPDGLEEVGALARTLTERSADILAYFDHPGSSNGPTEAVNGRLEHLRGIALGFRNLASYTIRSLIHAGRLKDHLAATT